MVPISGIFSTGGFECQNLRRAKQCVETSHEFTPNQQRQLLDAIDFIHKGGVYALDISHSNVGIIDGQAVIFDIGEGSK